MQAQTLKHVATLTGLGLHSGTRTTVRIGPAPAGAGCVFVRTDLPGRPRIRATEIDFSAPAFRTVLRNHESEIHTVEHLFSALSALGITDCLIEIDGVELPGMDGSALPFAQALLDAGLAPLDTPQAPLEIKTPFELADGIARVRVEPHAGALKITYTLNYPGHPLAQGAYTVELSQATYLEQLAPARTFAIKKDAEAMLAAGLGKGANYQNTVVIDGAQALQTVLRFKDEPVRHKILDLIGDLYTLGRPLHAHVVAVCSGHRANRELVRKLGTAE